MAVAHWAIVLPSPPLPRLIGHPPFTVDHFGFEVVFGVIHAVAVGAVADFEVAQGGGAAVDQLVGGAAGFEAAAVASFDAVLFIAQAQGGGAFEDVDELVLAVVASLLLGDFNWAVLGVWLLALWVVLAGARDIYEKTRHKGLLRGLPSLTRSYWGMQTAHLGMAVCALGVVLTSVGSFERDMRMAPGESVEIGGYQFIFEGAEHFEGPNFTSDKGTVRILEEGKQIAVLHPEKRLYTVQQSVMTEAGIDAGITRDLFVALGEPLDNGAWAVRVHIKPFVRWIWLGALLMALGGFVTAADRRFRRP